MDPPLVPAPFFQQVAHRFRLLGEPVRLEMLNRMHKQGEMTVQALVATTGHSQANVSKHLRLLLQEGMVARRQEGPYAYYSIADPTIASLCVLVCSQVRLKPVPDRA